MAESPTYYHSMSPILRSLKQFDMENFPLQAEVLYAKSPETVQEMPSYLKDATFHTAIVCPPANRKSIAAETGMDKPKTTKELTNNVKTSKEQPAMDTPLLPASILPPSITDALMTTVYEENKHPDYCTVTEHFKCGIEAIEDQMDTDTMSSPETEMCSDIEDTAKIDTSPITQCPFIQRTSRKAQTLPLKERLGSRMNVKRFLEKIKSSTSESFLEESQCKALVHALERRLAVIQGE